MTLLCSEDALVVLSVGADVARPVLDEAAGEGFGLVAGPDAARSVERDYRRARHIRGMHVKREHVVAAIRNARAGPVPEGSVGAGTGTVAFGWKGGIGTSSRLVPGGYTLGVLVQSNYGGVLTMGGVRVGEKLRASADGSCMIVVATDAPVDARDLGRIAARAVFGLARTGSTYSNGSGDFAIAFSTSMRSAHGNLSAVTRIILPPDAMSPFFEAVLEATEEAVYNSLVQATSVGGKIEAIPLGPLRKLLDGHGIRP